MHSPMEVEKDPVGHNVQAVATADTTRYAVLVLRARSQIIVMATSWTIHFKACNYTMTRSCCIYRGTFNVSIH